jgi:phosphatidylglycerophosphatase C
MKLVFCDFDGTLTTRDTIFPLCIFMRRANGALLRKVARVVAALMLLKLRLLSNQRLKEEFCRCLLSGETQERMDALLDAFAREYIAGILREPVVRMLAEHRRMGAEVYIVSSNFEFLLRPLQRVLHADGVIATEAEVRGGRYTGRLSGPACAGSEKLSRVLERFGRDLVRNAVAYGDSADDRPLLDFVKTPVWVS